MKREEKLLEESVQQYREMLAQINVVKRTVRKADFEEMHEISVEINKTQEKARTIENEFSSYVAQFPELKESILYKERMDLVGQILKVRELILPKCKGSLTINRKELSKIANGRVLMSGYHSNIQKKGRLIKVVK